MMRGNKKTISSCLRVAKWPGIIMYVMCLDKRKFQDAMGSEIEGGGKRNHRNKASRETDLDREKEKKRERLQVPCKEAGPSLPRVVKKKNIIYPAGEPSSLTCNHVCIIRSYLDLSQQRRMWVNGRWHDGGGLLGPSRCGY